MRQAFHGWPRRAPTGRTAYVNGAYVPHARARVHIEDRGLQFSDAIYEVWGVSNGALLDEEEHFDRLERSLRELQMAMPMARGALKFVLRELVRRNGVDNGILYMQVTRGAVRRDHAIPKASPRPSLILTARRISAKIVEARRKAGVRVITRPDERWARRDIKSTSLLANILAKTAARDAGAFEAWLIEDGYVTEGSSTTAWIVDAEGRLVTRSLSNAVLPGVTRRVIMEAAAEARLPVVERRFTRAEALAAKEAFITAATLGATPVVEIDGKPVGAGKPGAVSRRVQELYAREAARKTAGKED
ncbi:MAG TPA: D-amino-acid transaminase [Rhizomicrobium sp.]|nr:D-amino-acid transaminase [Rhizomicrobium sp.]